MATGSDHTRLGQQSPEYLTLRESYQTIIDCVKESIESICNELFSVGVISTDLRDYIRHPTYLNSNKAGKLVDAVIDKIEHDQEVFQHFITTLNKEGPCTQSTVKVLEKKYQEKIAEEGLEQIGSIESEASSNKFPFLDFKNMEDDEKEELKIQLLRDIKNIKRLYARMERSVLSALKTHTDFEEVRNYVTSIVQDLCSQEEIKKIKGAESIYTLSTELSLFKSFFNYDIVKDIVEEFGSDSNEKQLLSEYELKFRKFCERSVFEVPPDIFHNGDTSNLFKCCAFKHTPKFNLPKLEDAIILKTNVAEILGIERRYLITKSITEGCICIKFLIPETLANKIFPLSETQVEKLHVMQIKFVEDDNEALTLDTVWKQQNKESEKPLVIETDNPKEVDAFDDFNHTTKPQVIKIVQQLLQQEQSDFLVSQKVPLQLKAIKVPQTHVCLDVRLKEKTIDFETQSWEVEIAKKVVNFIKNKSVPQVLRQEFAKKLCRLASGEWNETMHRPLESNNGIQLYKADLVETASILYQVLVRFSERQTKATTGYTYTDTIIVWDTVLKHDSLQHAVQDIITAIHKIRRPAKQTQLQEKLPKNTFVAKPQNFTKKEIEEFSDVGTKTYTATTDILLNFLDDENDRRDYPIKVTEEEHDIIMLPSTKPIVVLGRSGTGKTTICLNRLWLNFRNHKKQVMGENEPFQQKKVATRALSIEEAPYNQLFITKNHALCTKMKKRFYDFVAGCQHTKEFLHQENEPLPEKLTEVEYYPLFITAKQFFTMLDKSLGDEREFFKPGTIVQTSINQADIHSLSLLFDIPQDDSDDEEDDQVLVKRQKKAAPMKEITADEFAAEIWPQISKHCDDPKPDPLLVWTEIESIIEGSGESLETKDGCLLEDEYFKKSQKQAPRAITREQVYKLFLHYKNYCMHKDSTKHRFSNGKFIWNLNKRLQNIKKLPWSIHEIYIDEVQDFTQAEISVLLKCCKDPNRSFFAGDTAQTIMKGISFRFEDLKSLFHNLKAGLKCSVPKVHKLTQNYRSHSSITDMASSVIDLLQEYFPYAYDKLPPDDSNIFGPKPLFICSKSLLDNFLLKQSTENATSIEFGADQVIIARDSGEKGRKNMPKYLQDEIILNVQECKGLEFNDVLLYNFFTDTPQQEMWRISAKYLRDHEDKIVSKETHSNVHPLDFNERSHKSFCAELKILYTVITRARCHIWIYEDTPLEDLPMIKYWQLRNLIKIVSQDDIVLQNKTQLEMSSTSDWKKQGDFYMEKRLWYAAKKCYEKAKEKTLENIAYARALEQKALQTKQTDIKQFRYVAVLFIQCALLQPQKDHVKNAAFCLFRAKMYPEALKLFEFIQEYKYAIHICKAHLKRDKDILIRLYEKCGKYKSATKLLLQKKSFDLAINMALNDPSCYNLVKELLYKRIKTAISNQDPTLVKLVKGVPKFSEQIHYLKKAKMYSEACEFLQDRGEYKSLFRICRAQHLYSKGIEIAEQAGSDHIHIKHSFILLRAEHHIITKPTKLADERDELKKLLEANISKDHEARACLLQSKIIIQSDGNLKRALDFCTKAHSIYRSIQSRIGEIEAVHMINLVREKRNEYTLEHSKLIVDTITMLNQLCNLLAKPTAAFTSDVKEAEDFYTFEKYGIDYYYVSKQVDLFFQIQPSGKEDTDSDGMIQLDKKLMLRKLTDHYQAYVREFRLYLYHFKDLWHKKLKQPFPFHSELLMAPFYLQKSYPFYSVYQINQYLEMLDTVFYIHTKNPAIFQISSDILEPINRILSPFSQLCLNFRDKNFQYIAHESRILKETLGTRAFEELKIMICETQIPNIDKWLQARRLIYISGEDKVYQVNLLIAEQVAKFNIHQQAQTHLEKQHLPLAYVQTDIDSYQHIFAIWEQTCKSYTANGDILTATNNSLIYFINVIAKQKDLYTTFSLENLINILTIQCSAIFALLSMSQKTQIIIPESFEQMIKTFDLLNCSGQLQACQGLMVSCANQEITSNSVHDCTRILILIVKLIIGEYETSFCPLQKAVREGTDTEIIHCLVLIFTIIGNLLVLNTKNIEIEMIFKNIIKILQEYNSQRVVSKIYSNLKSIENTKDLFSKIIQPLLKIPQLPLLKVIQTDTVLKNKKINIKLIFSSKIPCIKFQWESNLKLEPQEPKKGIIDDESTIETNYTDATATVQDTGKAENAENSSITVTIEHSKEDFDEFHAVNQITHHSFDPNIKAVKQSKEDINEEIHAEDQITDHSFVAKDPSISAIDQEKSEFLNGNSCIACHRIAEEGHFSSLPHVVKKQLYTEYIAAEASYKIVAQIHLKEIVDECRQADITEYDLEQKVQEAEQLIEANNQRINKMYEEKKEWKRNAQELKKMRDELSQIILILHKKKESKKDNNELDVSVSDEAESEEEEQIDEEITKAKLISSSKRRNSLK